MQYLQAALSLKSFIEESNTVLFQNKETLKANPNRMRIQMGNDSIQEIEMKCFTNDFVQKTLQSIQGSNAFIITDISSKNINGKKYFYMLYKAYHSKIEKGLVFYQMINEDSLSPSGSIQFSNLEDNIFYSIEEPEGGESTCNAMETDKVIENGKSIVFFIGHTHEKRLAYDIERLIFDTVNNVTRHPKLHFSFIIQISVYGGNISGSFIDQLNEIEEFTKKYVYPEYKNATFDFIIEQEEDLALF